MLLLKTVTVIYFSWIISSPSANLDNNISLYSTLYLSKPSSFNGIKISSLNFFISTFRLLMVIFVITDGSNEFSRSLYVKNKLFLSSPDAIL